MRPKRAIGEAGGDVGLQRRLVFAEAGVAPWPEQRDLRVGHQLRRKAAEVLRQPIDDLDHRRAHVPFVLVPMRVEPGPVVVLLQLSEKRDRLAGKHGKTSLPDWGLARCPRICCRICDHSGTVAIIDALRSLLGDRVSTTDAVREHHSHGESWHAPRQPGCGGVPPVHRRSRRRGRGLRRAPRADDSVRHGQLAGRPRQRRPRRRQHRPHPHDPRPPRQPGRSRRHGRSRAHPQDAERTPEEHRPDVPDRPRRRRHHRRHGRHARLGHHRRALRHDARERAGSDGGAGRRPGDPHRRPRAEVVLGLRPHAAVRRLGRHARRHHRGDAAAVSAGPKRWPPRSARLPRWRARPPR